jgi:microcystin-dependent protein
MSSPFVAEITIYPFNFPPKGWAFCDGQLLPISQNTALFSLLGTQYGGDGKSTFGLPNMQGNAAVCQGQSSASGTQYFVGETTGVENVTLIQSEMPAHAHNFVAQTAQGTSQSASNNQLALCQSGSKSASFTGNYLTTSSTNVPMVQALSIYGSSFPHNNMQPYLTLNFCIALQGVFPSRP